MTRLFQIPLCELRTPIDRAESDVVERSRFSLKVDKNPLLHLYAMTRLGDVPCNGNCVHVCFRVIAAFDTSTCYLVTRKD